MTTNNDFTLDLIPPTEEEEVIKFEDLDEEQRFNWLHDWGLISKSAKEKQELKKFVFSPRTYQGTIPCEVIGCITWEGSKEEKATVVISVDGGYTKIHPAYFKEMQGTSYDSSSKPKKSKSVIPSEYIIYDIETTGLSPQNAEIIEIGAIKVVNQEIVDRFESLIALPDYIDPESDIATHIHGISFEMLKGAPDVNEVLNKFVSFIGDLPLVGHNILSFDSQFINYALDKYLKTSIKNKMIDTFILSRRYYNQLPSRTLGAMAEHFNIPYVGAHRAVADCEINHHVFLAIGQYMNEKGYKITEKAAPKKKSYGKTLRVETITTDKTVFDESHFLFGKNCALSDISSKEEVAQMIKDAGGEPQNNVTRKTNILIHGDGANTAKVKKAREYNEKYNQEVLILSESEFNEKIQQIS